MARDTSKLVTIPGELHSSATGNIVSASQEIFDYDSNSYQSQLNKQVYNVSAHDSSATAKYTLDEAIAAVPTSYHVGGLILTFVSKEGDFEMYQLKSKDWTDDTEKWGIIKTAIVEDNPEFVEVHLDGSDKVLYGVQKDGNFYFGGGVPSQVKSYVDEKTYETDSKIDELARKVDSSISIAIEQIENDIDRLDASVNTGFARVDASMIQMESHFDASINALDASVYNLGYYEENPEYAEVHLDSSSKVLYGVQKDGNFYFGGGVPSQIQSYVDEKDAKIDASVLDIETRFYNVNEHDGSVGINYTLEEAIAAVPEAYRRGGLILTFNSNEFADNSVYNNDNKYVQYRLMTDSWSTNTSDWALCSEDVLVENPDFVYVKTDNEDKILYGVKTNGDFFFGAGCPQQVKILLDEKLDEKVDKVENKSLINTDFSQTISSFSSNEWVEVKIDINNKVIEGIKENGEKYINTPINLPSGKIETVQDAQYIKAVTDKNGKIIDGIKKDGTRVFGEIDSPTIDTLVEKINEYSNVTLPFYKNHVYGSIPNIDYKGLQQDYTFGNRYTLTSEVYEKYDELLVKGYSSSVVIGKASDGQDIKVYEFKQEQVQQPSGFNKTVPTLMILCGQHGFEKSSTYGLYYFMKDVIENYTSNPLLFYFRNKVNIIIIPVANPSGWDARTYKNSNKVNLNRNWWVPNWHSPTSDINNENYGGLEPFDQPETAAIRDYVLSHKDEIDFFIDNHTCGGSNVSSNRSINWCDLTSCSDAGYDDTPYYKGIQKVIYGHIIHSTGVIKELFSQYLSEYEATSGWNKITRNNNAQIYNENTTYVKDDVVNISEDTYFSYKSTKQQINNYPANEESPICSHITYNKHMIIGWADSWAITQGIHAMCFEVFNGFPKGEDFTEDVKKCVSILDASILAHFCKFYSKY